MKKEKVKEWIKTTYGNNAEVMKYFEVIESKYEGLPMAVAPATRIMQYPNYWLYNGLGTMTGTANYFSAPPLLQIDYTIGAVTEHKLQVPYNVTLAITGMREEAGILISTTNITENWTIEHQQSTFTEPPAWTIPGYNVYVHVKSSGNVYINEDGGSFTFVGTALAFTSSPIIVTIRELLPGVVEIGDQLGNFVKIDNTPSMFKSYSILRQICFVNGSNGSGIATMTFSRQSSYNWIPG